MPSGVYKSSKRKGGVKGKSGVYKHKPQQGFQKGHNGFAGSEKTQFKKGRKSLMKGKKNLGITKEKHWNWQGGLSFEPYSVDWTKTLRRSIRERDHSTCQLCGRQQEDKVFDIHHIDYKKKNCNPDNLITLCRSCHSKTNFNRRKWIEFFKGRIINIT